MTIIFRLLFNLNLPQTRTLELRKRDEEKTQLFRREDELNMSNKVFILSAELENIYRWVV